MILSNHIKERMAQRGYNHLMLEFILSCDDIDYEHNRYYISRASKADLRNELINNQERLFVLRIKLAQLKKIRNKIPSIQN